MLFPIIPIPLESPASRRCHDCATYAPHLGSYGPPVAVITGDAGCYASTDLSAHWFCEACSASRWVAWNVDDIEKRRREVWAEVARRAAALAEWDAQLRLFREVA